MARCGGVADSEAKQVEMSVNDLIVDRALQEIRARNRSEHELKQLAAGQRIEPVRGVCFHCQGTGRCNCVACDPPRSDLLHKSRRARLQ